MHHFWYFKITGIRSHLVRIRVSDEFLNKTAWRIAPARNGQVLLWYAMTLSWSLMTACGCSSNIYHLYCLPQRSTILLFVTNVILFVWYFSLSPSFALPSRLFFLDSYHHGRHRQRFSQRTWTYRYQRCHTTQHDSRKRVYVYLGSSHGSR